MFGKKINAIFWSLVLPSIFFVFANTNFVTPKLILQKGATSTYVGTQQSDYYKALLIDVFNVNFKSETYNETINWIVLISLGILFSLISCFSFVRFIILSGIFANKEWRTKVPGVKKQIKIGNYDYKLFGRTENKIDSLDTNIIFAFNVVMIVSVLSSLIINLVIPFVMSSMRETATIEELKKIGNDLAKVNNFLSTNYPNTLVLYSNLSGVLFCFFNAFILLVVAITREIIKTKHSKKELKENANCINE